MTTTRPTIDRAQVHPEAGSIPMAVKAWWNRYMIQATSHSMGPMIVLNKSPMSSLGVCRARPAG